MSEVAEIPIVFNEEAWEALQEANREFKKLRICSFNRCPRPPVEGKLTCQHHLDYAKKYRKAYYKSHKSDVDYFSYENHLRWQYGISHKELTSMLVSQDNKCAICREEFTDTPCVDHNHNIGAIRGLLCRGCNTKIAIFDNALLLESAAKYLSLTIKEN